jgi:hypothetical protein
MKKRRTPHKARGPLIPPNKVIYSRKIYNRKDQPKGDEEDGQKHETHTETNYSC